MMLPNPSDWTEPSNNRQMRQRIFLSKKEEDDTSTSLASNVLTLWAPHQNYSLLTHTVMNRCWCSGTGHISALVVKTSNHRRQVGKDLQSSLLQPSAPSRAERRVRSCCSRLWPVNFRKSSRMENPPPPWALPQITNTLPLKNFPHIQLDSPLVQTVLAGSYPFAGHSWQEPGSSSSAILLWRTVVRSLFSLLIPRLKTTQFCQPLLRHVSFQIFLHFSLPSLYLFPAALQWWKLSHCVSIDPTTFLIVL